MDLFHGTTNITQRPSGSLTHFGSMFSAIQRLESMQSMQNYALANPADILAMGPQAMLRHANIEQTITDFANFMATATISQYAVTINQPLQLNDCWGDDPIGSGGLEIFSGNTDLSPTELKQLTEIFHPFKGVIYPNNPALTNMSRNQVKAIKKEWENNSLFKEELTKRKKYNKALGQDWETEAEHQEIVWLGLTCKLINWATKNKYDGFVYQNNAEDMGSKTYVTLKQQAIGACLESYVFNKEMFLDTVPPVYPELSAKYIIAQTSQANMLQPSVDIAPPIWGGQDPKNFWIKKTAP